MASCLVLSGVAPSAHAAGLGRINVFSALGQPLRAEIELSATRDELSGLRAGLASAEAFRQAGLELPSNLLEIKFSVDRRPDGRAVIKLSSDRPINDPFIDMLLEINWPAGRLVREYTFLLDPPEVAAKAAAPVSAPVAPAAARAPAKPTEAVARPAVAEPAGTAATSGERQVKRGETLRRIAEETRPEGVSLEQMLVGLFRANQEAFDGGNINRLKAGRILSIPEKEALASVSDAEAKKIVVAHAADWNAYRRKLAGVAAQAPAAEAGTRQAAEGRITPKVEDQAAPAAQPKDQVKVATAEKPGAKGGATVSSEDLLAKEKALQEANVRLALLEKNVAELQKLIELKNQSLAELQKQAAAASTPVAAAPKAVEPPKPVEAPKAVEPTKVPEPAESPKAVEPPAAEPPKAADAAAPTQEKPAEAEAPKADAAPPADAAQAPKAEEAPLPKPKPALPPPPPPEPEPSFLAELFGNPAMLAGGGGILALLAGYVVYKRRRESKGEAPLAMATTLSQPGTSLTANSVFRTTGGQSVDTSHTPAQTDFSQAGPGSIDTDEVDPVAEADVYMAYGRDAQAEEILLEARQKDPKRLAIVLKLLEIYANRKSVKQFETLATDLYGETGGVGADWEKAAALGLKIDPQNPLYGGSGQAAPAAVADGRAFDPDATLVVSAGNLKNTVTMPGQLAPLAAAATAAAAAAVEVPAAVPVESSGSPVSLDFDLGVSDSTAAVEPEPAPSLAATDLPAAVAEADTLTLSPGALDFDLGIPEAPLAATPVAPASPEPLAALDFNLPEISVEPVASADTSVAADTLDFDLGMAPAPAPTMSSVDVPAMVESVANPDDAALEPASLDEGNLEFDVQLTESTVLGQPMRDSAFDMASISLDLAETPPAELTAQAGTHPGQGFAESETVVNPDFSSEQVDTLVNPDFTITQAETVVDPGFGMTSDVAPDLQISASEEVATKLDLAKAYEEMGDLEGARELLQEVVSEGDAGQRERAQTALARIGG